MASNSWKQYGGIYKTDKLHNVGIGTLVADKVLLRQKNLTEFTVQGTIVVTQDAVIQGQLNLSGNANLTRDLYLKENAYIAKKLYFGTIIPDPATSYSYIYGDSTSSTASFGVNTTTPKTVFDINATVSNVLTVRTTASTIRNILAENSTSNGVTSQADTGSASIGFFIGNVASSISPNSSITGTAGNTITVSSTTAIINSSGTSTINSLNGNTTIFSSGATNMTSKVVASNKGIYNNILGELVTIYDTSNSLFLYDNYENSDAYTGTALTLVAKDNRSNTLLSIVSPNKGGLSIGGGTYTNDSNRTMGLLGTTSTTGNFIPSQLVVSGNNLIKYKTTTGFNTYAPRTENYVVDINGPTHMGNGELSTTLRVGFEILSMKTAKRYPSVGFAVGTPSAAIVNSPFTAKIAYTSNGGQSWTTTNILTTASGGLYNTANRYCVYSYDQNYTYIGTRTNFLYYTANGGSSWTQVLDLTSGIIKRFSTIYVCNNTTAAPYRFVFGGYLTDNQDNVLKPQLYYYDTGNLNLMPSGTNPINYSAMDVSLGTINDSDGSGNFVYLVGTGIIKVDLSGSIPLQKYYINSGITYNSVFCYDTSYAVAVGQNTISYTTDSINWSNSVVTGVNGGSFNIRSVYIYDASNAVAVGDGGVFVYTINGSQHWRPVPSGIINSSGLGSIINATNNNLRGIFMPDLNSVVIADVSNNFVIGSTPGNSKIIYGFFPNLFNRVNNKVLEASGNMQITGDILIDGSGQIMTTNKDFYLLNTTVQNITMGSSASVINIGGESTSNKIPNTLYVDADVSLNSRIFINGDVSLNSRLLLNGDASLNSRVYIAKDVSMGSRLFVSSDVSFISNLNVKGNITSNSTIYSTYYDSPNGNVFIGPATTSKNIYIGSQVNNGAANSTSLYIGNDNDVVYLRGEVFTQTTQNLNVYAKVIQLNDGENGNAASATSGIQIRDNSNDLQGFIRVSSNMEGFNLKTTQSSNVLRLDNDTMVLNNGVTHGMVVLTPATTNYTGSVIDSSYVITVNNNIDGNYNGSGNFYVATKSILNGDTSMNSCFFINGDTSMNAKLFVKGDVSLNSTLRVGGDTSMNSRLFVNGDLSLNSRLLVNGDVSLNATLRMGGDVSLNSRLYVNKTSLFNADVSINSNLNLPNGGISIGKPTVTSGYVLDLSGNINHAGVVFQF